MYVLAIGRNRSLLRALLLATLVAPVALVLGVQAMGVPEPRSLSPSHPATAAAWLPIIENVGQFDPQVAFAVTGPSGGLWLTRDSLWVSVAEPDGTLPGADPAKRRTVTLRLTLPEADLSRPEPLRRSSVSVNHFLGGDPTAWRANVPAWDAVVYRGAYPGLDLEVSRSGSSGWDWALVSQSDAGHHVSSASFAEAQVLVEGADSLVIRDDAWLAETEIGTIRLPRLRGSAASPVLGRRPDAVAAQLDHGGNRTPMQDADGSVYVSLPGAATDQATAMTKDSSGNLYVTGYTSSASFPTTEGAWDRAHAGGTDAFVAKLGPDGSLIYATYIGGSGNDRATGVALDAAGNAYITGFTNSTDFPTVGGAFQSSNLGGYDVFVTKLNSAGSGLVFSTYLGKSGVDRGQGIAVDSGGFVYVAGYTNSSNFAGYYSGGEEAFVTKFNPVGSAIAYKRFVGGSGDDRAYAITLDTSGHAFITGSTTSDDFPGTADGAQTTRAGGSDAYVTEVVDAYTLGLSTYLGGSADDCGLGIALDGDGRPHVTGYTYSTTFPTPLSSYDRSHNGGRDAFFARLNAYGDEIQVSGYLGGMGDDVGRDIALNSAGDIYIAGDSTSVNYPVTANALHTTIGAPDGGFLSRVSAGGDILKYSTYVGQAADGVIAASADNACLCGHEATGAFVQCLQAEPAEVLGPEFALLEDLVITTEAGDHWPPLPGDTLKAGIQFGNGGAGWLEVNRVGVRCRRNGSESCDFWHDGSFGIAAGVNVGLTVFSEDTLVPGSYALQTSYSPDGIAYEVIGNVVSFVVAAPTATPTVSPTVTHTVVPTATQTAVPTPTTPVTPTGTPPAPGDSTVYLPLTLRTQ